MPCISFKFGFALDYTSNNNFTRALANKYRKCNYGPLYSNKVRK